MDVKTAFLNGDLDEELYMKQPEGFVMPDQLEYSRAIRCLMYVMTSTRPDIAYVVGRLSRYPSATKKQTCITGSTMESKFVALAAEWLRNLIHEIPIWSKPIAPISIRCDSALKMAKAYSQWENWANSSSTSQEAGISAQEVDWASSNSQEAGINAQEAGIIALEAGNRKAEGMKHLTALPYTIVKPLWTRHYPPFS
ncbi:zinc finger, CCHC-type containing protein [Tanacetum coccineum]